MRRDDTQDAVRRSAKVRRRSPQIGSEQANFNFEDFSLRQNIDFSQCGMIRRTLLPSSYPPVPSTSPVLSFCAISGLSASVTMLPTPLYDFSSPFLASLLPNIAIPFTSPTPIQSVSIPLALSGSNVIGIAETGSGKTLAFLISALCHLFAHLPLPADSRSSPIPSPICFIMAPTRELVVQIEEVATGLMSTTPYSAIAIFGGRGRREEIRRIRTDHSLALYVATPGRALDYLQAGVFSLMDCGCVVLDEADLMLSLGFRKQVTQILSQVRPDRICHMFCSTWNQSVETWARQSLFVSQESSPVLVRMKSASVVMESSTQVTANPRVKQRFVRVDSDEVSSKCDVLLRLLESELLENHAKILIFCSSKKRSDAVTRRLRDEEGLPCLSLHSNLSQGTRDWTIRQFRTDEDLPVLVCTDVASRGVDVVECGCVVNLDMPTDIERYVHRIGRTARGVEKSGESISLFVSKRDGRLSKELVDVLEGAKQIVPEYLRI